jgi:hypothetical protein
MTDGRPGWFRSLWLLVWPVLTFIVFASLAVVRMVPTGETRAALAGPILLIIPGSLTLGAVFSRSRRPQGAVFVCYAVLLSVVWSVFASLALYAHGSLITAVNTYWCLLIVTAVLGIVAEARILLERQETGRRVAQKPSALGPDRSEAEISDAETPTQSSRSAFYAILAVVAGLSLLAGGLYAYDHVAQPTSAGYTWIDWTGRPITGSLAVGPEGTELHFQIVHRQSNTTTFHLSAVWLGSTSSRPLAKPLNFTIGPQKTFQGTLFVPPLPDGCTYRVAIVLTAMNQIDSLTKKPQTWSINADVYEPHKSSRTCK